MAKRNKDREVVETLRKTLRGIVLDTTEDIARIDNEENYKRELPFIPMIQVGKAIAHLDDEDLPEYALNAYSYMKEEILPLIPAHCKLAEDIILGKYIASVLYRGEN